MSRLFGASLVTTLAMSALLLPAAADAKAISGAHQVSANTAPRVDRNVGFIPVNTMGRLPPFRVFDGRQYVRGPWVNFVAGGSSLSETIKFMRRSTVVDGAWADRRLTRAEKRAFVELADIGRDADVLVVQRGHPACAGLTLTQVRSIVAGKTTKWSQVAAPAGGSSDAIRLVHTRFTEKFIEPRFGASMNRYAGKPADDGGLQAAAADGSVAGITSWSRARGRSDVCAVPINGVQPTNVTVHDLKFPGAYPLTFVTSKKKLRQRYKGALIRRYVKFFQSEQAKKLMRGTGLIIKGEKQDTTTPGSSGPPQSAGPSQDSQGRPITPARDDAGVTSALTGDRLESESGVRWVFEPESVFRLLDGVNSGGCAAEAGTWTVIEGWVFRENGGGIIARVQVQLGNGPRDVTVEIDNGTADIAYVNGQRYARSRSFSGSC